MKSKCSFILKASISLILALLMLFGSMTTSLAAVVDELAETGWTAAARGKIYFAMPYTWTSNNSSVQYCIVKSDSSYCQPKVTLNKITNTDLYYGNGNFYDTGYGDDFNRMEIIANSNGWGDFSNWNNSTLSHYTNPLEWKCDTANTYYSFYYTSTDAKGASVEAGYNTDRGYALNRTQKVYVYTDTTRGGTYSNSETGGKVVASYYDLSADSTAAAQSFDTSSADGAEYYSVPCEVTLTATANTGYEFVGWYTAASGGTALATDSTAGRTVNTTTLKYHVISNDYTIYARFRAKQYTISYDKGANGTGTVSSTTKVHGVDATLSSSKFTRTGYTQTGWSTSDGGSKAYNLGGTYTTDASTTLYPFWTQNTYTVKKTETGGSGGTVKVGSTAIDTTGVSIAHGTYTVTVTAPTGYNVTAVSIGGTAQSITAGSSVTINSVAITSAKTIAVTYAKKTYAITLSETGASGGTMQVDSAAFTSGSTVTHGSHTFRVDAPTGYVIDSISGIGTWTKSGDNSYATLGSTSITSAQTISVTYVASGRPSLDAISDVSKDANTTTFNVTANISDEDKKTGTLTATASSSDTTVATVGTPTVSGSTVTIPVTIKGKVDSSTISVTLKDGGTDLNTQTFSVEMTEPTFTIAAKTIYVTSSAVNGGSITNGGVSPSSIAYTSSNSEYITVGASNGKLTAAKVPSSDQTATITATATYGSGYQKTTTYTATLKAPSLTASSSEASGNIGDTATGSVSGSNPDPTSSSNVSGYSWSSSNSNVVAVSSSTSATPTFTFKKNGSATITLTVTYKNTSLTKTATTSITVNDPTVAFSSSTAASINVGGTVQRTATGSTLGSGANGTVAYSGTNEYINVASDGTVTGLKPTSSAQTVTATYTVTCGGQTSTATATYNVSVTAPTVSITSASTANVGATVSLTASSTGATTTPTYTWSVAAGTGTASVSGSTLTAKTPGTVTITVRATYNSDYYKEATQTFTVKTPAVSLSGNAKVAVGNTITLTPSVTNVTGTPTYTYSSSATSKATVTNAGVVSGVAAGTATITVTATLGDWSDTATKSITVETPAITVKDSGGTTLDTSNPVYTTVGTNTTLTITPNFSDTLYAETSKSSVATVAITGTGSSRTLTITPVAAGTCNISVSTDSGFAPTGVDIAATAAAMPDGLFKDVFELAATGAVDTTTVTIPVRVAAADNYRYFYFTNGVGWSGVKIYLWQNSNTNNKNAEWPGAAMVKIGKNENNQDVYAYRFDASAGYDRLIISDASNSDNRVNIGGTTDLTLGDHNAAWCSTANTNNTSTAANWYNCTIAIPQVLINDATVNLGSDYTLTATQVSEANVGEYNWVSGTTTVATVTADTNTTPSTTVHSVNVGTTVVTVKAFAVAPTNWTLDYSSADALPFIGSTDTATITVTSEPKTVTFGEKKTDNGSTFTDGSGHVSAKYYEEATEAPTQAATQAPTSSDSGTGTYYLHIGKQNAFTTNTAIKFTWNGSYYYASYNVDTTTTDYPFVINTKNTALGDSDKSSSAQAITTLASSYNPDNISMWYTPVYANSGYYGYDCFKFGVNSGSTGTIYITFTPSGGVVFRTSVSSGSSSGGSSSGGSSSGGSSSGTGYTGTGTSFSSGDSVPYGKVAVFTAVATYTVTSGGNTDTYAFSEWVDGSDNTLSTNLEYVVKITEAKTVRARYYKVYKLSTFDTYEKVNNVVTFVTAPPKTITVKHGTDTYTYNYDGTAPGGHPGTPDALPTGVTAYPDPLPINSGGTFGQGNYIQYLAGDEITLIYSAMASSETFKGVFYNNSEEYYLAKPSSEGYIPHDYAADHTLYMNSAYYIGTSVTVPSGLPTTTVDHDAHSIKFTGTQDYKNIDLEVGTKRKVYFSDYTNAVIGSKNTDDYYYDGEALSVTGDQLTVAAAMSSTQTNQIVGSSVGFYKATAEGGEGEALTSGEISALGLSVTNATSTGTTSANGTALVISGNMPSYDLYIKLNMTSSYTIKLGNKIISDVLANKSRLAEVADITITGGAATLTATSSADVTASTSAATGTALNLTTAWKTGWSQYYIFVGWYWGTDSAPDYEKGFISDKLTLNYTPKKGGTIWAVGTRSLFINGSKYITGKDTNWYSENGEWKNQLMSFDAESGRYYWEITDTMFAAAGYNYKTYKEGGGATEEYGRYFESGGNYYWEANEDKYHGKSYFQILDKETGYADKTLWKNLTSFTVDTPANGPTYGKIYPRDKDTDEIRKSDGQGFINFNETNYAGQSSPLRIWYDPSASDNAKLTVTSTKIYSNIYVSNGFNVGSTLSSSPVTVEPVVDGVVKSSGQAGYFDVGKQGNGWDPDSGYEGHVNHYKPQKKGATVRITKTAGGSDKIEAFFIYDITNKTVRAERNVQNSGQNYYIDLTLANEEQNLYIVPIVEEAGANVTITFDATQLNRKQWGDIVTAYAWYSGSGGNALGAYPGQPMIPSDDMTTWTTTFKGTNSGGDEIQGITFSNYVDGSHTWLGCDNIMGTVSDQTTGTAEGGIINVYNHVDSGTNGEYSRTNFKAQTYDYREPIALYDRFKNTSDHVNISFSMKDGNSSLISWEHNQLLSHNIVTLEPHPNWSKLNWEYLTNAKGDKYVDMNGKTMKTKPTASFYVAAKGQVMYNNSDMKYVFYSGTSFDTVTGVTYGGHSGVNMNYAVQWYVYDASGNYITNVLTAGIADLSSNGVDSYIGKVLEDMGYPVDGKSVAVCYDKPRYMLGDTGVGEAGSNDAVSYDGKGINVTGHNFDAYRFTGQWNAVASSELVTVKVGVGMMTDSGEVLAPNNTQAYGNATATYTGSMAAESVTNEDGDKAPFTASDGSFVRTAVRDAENNPVKLNASAQNFIGWYYYDANTGDFVKANYASNENFYPSYSTKDVTFYAMYRASAIYQYNYQGREEAKTYSASGEDLTAAEMGNGNKINPASHVDDIKAKVPSGISVFKKTIDFSPTNYGTWTKTPDSKGYILDITGFATSVPTYTLTAFYKKNVEGESEPALVSVSKEAAYNGAVVDLTSGTYAVTDNTSKPGGTTVTSYYDKAFLGWYAYDPTTETIGDELISTQHNYGLRLTCNQSVIAVYDEDNHALPSDGWHVAIDENVITKELTTVNSGTFYNDTIVRVRNSTDVTATLPSGAKIGVLVVIKGDGATKEPNTYGDAQLLKLVKSTSTSYVTPGTTATTKSGLIISNMQAEKQTNFNRTDLAVKSDFAKTNGKEYCVYAYFYDGSDSDSGYHFTAASAVKTYE